MLRWLKLVFGGVVSLVLLLMLFLVILNQFYFSETMNFVSHKIEAKHGVKLSVGKLSGSLIKGVALLEDVTVSMNHSSLHNFNLKVGKVEVHFKVPKLLLPQTTIDKLTIIDVQGDVELLELEGTKPENSSNLVAFNIEQFELAAVDVTVNEKICVKTGKKIFVFLDKINIAPLTSNKFLQNILFDSNIEGSINYGDFYLYNDNGKTIWDIKYFPVDLIGHYLGGAVSWMLDGAINVHMSAVKEGDNLSMHWMVSINQLSTMGIAMSQFSSTISNLIRIGGLMVPDNISSSFSLIGNKQDFATLDTLRGSPFLNELSLKLLSQLNIK